MKRSWLALLLFGAPPAFAADPISTGLYGPDKQQVSDSADLSLLSEFQLPRSEEPSLRNQQKSGKFKVVKRCRAQELSLGTALGWMIILATGCVIQMPGSCVTQNRGGLVKLAPELGIIQAGYTLLVVGHRVFRYQEGWKRSAIATLMLRYFTAKDNLWWRDRERNSSSQESRLASDSCLAAEEFSVESKAMGGTGSSDMS